MNNEPGPVQVHNISTVDADTTASSCEDCSKLGPQVLPRLGTLLCSRCAHTRDRAICPGNWTGHHRVVTYPHPLLHLECLPLLDPEHPELYGHCMYCFYPHRRASEEHPWTPWTHREQLDVLL